MADPAELPRAELERARDLGAATYLSAYFHLMTRELGVDADTLGVQGMALVVLDPMNHATQAMWCAMMEDRPGKEAALMKFQQSLDAL